MPRKYKFFIKEKGVVFKQSKNSGANNQKEVKRWVRKFIERDLSRDEKVIWPDLKSFIKELKSNVPFIPAGGGYVMNSKGELLVIHRRGAWDLPKGKLEKGEKIKKCALREVEEECGISNLKIEGGAFFTYHLYREKGKTVVKESHWFLMKTDSLQDPVPQVEEDIIEAKWIKRPVAKKYFDGSYNSIKEVFNHFSGVD